MLSATPMISLRYLLPLLASGIALAADATVADVRRGFENPPDDARIMMRWWWFGPAVSKPELEREMRLMKEGGIGGFEVQPVYPMQLEGNLPYLSDEFIDALRFTSEKARELGLRMDLTLASGWPYGGPHTPITEAAGRLRCDRLRVAAGATTVALPKIGEGERFLAAFAGSKLLDPPADGQIHLPAGSAERQVLCFIASRTHQKVKRAAVGAEGWVLDHYNRAAVEHHLHTVGDRLMQAFGANPPYAVFSDSLEVFASDWADDFLAEFRKRRGYDLTPYLPALAGDFGEKTAAVRVDWGKTLTELAEERYLTPIEAWARAHHTRFRSQTYGVPPVTLSSNALVDLPEGEHPHWREFSQTRQAASACHIYGKPVTSSETWTWLHSPVFRATPLDMKAEADLHFLNGINQLVGHGWPYSPPSAGYPGWRFYAAAVFDQDNPWWIAMPDITKYLQRVSYVLRQGKPVNDVAVYLPVSDAYAGFTLGNDSVDRSMQTLLGPTLIPQILDAGYNFDFIDDGAIEKVGIKYPVLILPHVKLKPPEIRRKIDEYRKKGGIVVATRKEDEPTLGKRLRELLPPDFVAEPPAPQIGVVHRKLADGDIYFLVNTSNQQVRTDAKLRASGQVHLDLAPYESRVLILGHGEHTPRPNRDHQGAVDLTDWKLTFPDGNSSTANQLRSWTDDPAKKFFSGAATYEKTVTIPTGGAFTLSFGEGTPIPEKQRRNGTQAWLDSPVREAAVVYINGQRAGSIWCPPYELPINLKRGENQIRVVVGNLALNAMAGKPLPDYTALIAKFGDRFQPQDMNEVKPEPAGLLGPITLTAR